MVETEPDRSFVCTGSCGGEKELESAKRVAGPRMTRSIQVVAGANVCTVNFTGLGGVHLSMYVPLITPLYSEPGVWL